jgi:hypothetical protein
MTRGGCPGQAELAGFAAGTLSEASFERTASHVVECDACGARLDQRFTEDDGAGAILRDLRDAREASGSLCDHGGRIARALARGEVRVGRFDVIREVGAGSGGHVFLACDRDLDRLVAIKVLRSGAVPFGGDAQAFHREARTMARLAHPGIVRLHETGTTQEGIHYLVTEYVDGETLEARLARGRVPREETLSIVTGVAEALAYAHEHGVIHRDVKPSNVILDRDGRPHLTDFGIA